MKNGATMQEKLLAKQRQRMANTTLGEEDIRAIRRAAAKGEVSVAELAGMYDLSPDSIKKIVKRHTFSWVRDVEELPEKDFGAADGESVMKLMGMLQEEGGEGEAMTAPKELTEAEKRAISLGGRRAFPD